MNNNETLTNSAVALLLMLMLGLVFGFASRPQFEYVPPAKPEPVEPISAEENPKGHAQQYRDAELAQRFDQALAMLHAKRYDYAVKALERVIALSPGMAEAYVNLGFAHIGLEHFDVARNAFEKAIDLNPYQANAYWGLAVSLEHLNDLEGALGAMRAFIHLSPPNDPFVRKARSALWEWETQLKRGPLPEAEQEWIDRRSKEWQEKDGPEADMPEPQDHKIKLGNPH